MIAISNEDVATAVEFIRTNIADGIQVSDISRMVDLSRSTLDNRFKQILDRTVRDEFEWSGQKNY